MRYLPLTPADRTRLRQCLLAVAENLQPDGKPGALRIW